MFGVVTFCDSTRRKHVKTGWHGENWYFQSQTYHMFWGHSTVTSLLSSIQQMGHTNCYPIMFSPVHLSSYQECKTTWYNKIHLNVFHTSSTRDLYLNAWGIKIWSCLSESTRSIADKISLWTQIAKYLAPTWGPPGSCRPQMGPMLAPWTLLSGRAFIWASFWECNSSKL